MRFTAIGLIFLAATLQAQNDPRLEAVSTDLKALSRIATLTKNIYDTKQVMLAIVDDNIEQFREPQGDGSYRWASLQREEAGRVKQERTIDRVSTEDKLTTFELSAPRGYRVIVMVPRKRGVFTENNPVHIRNILVEWTEFNGRRHQQDLAVDVWVKPGDSHGVALPDIGKTAKVVVHAGIEASDKRAVAETALLQAKLVDDPANPHFPIVRRLLGIRALIDRDQIRRSDLKTAVDEAILAVPGEMQKRFAETEVQTSERLARATSGQMRGAVGFGDATPDVIVQLEEVGRLLSGTYEEQSRAREKLQALIELLRAP
jgi:hypothetical protein